MSEGGKDDNPQDSGATKEEANEEPKDSEQPPVGDGAEGETKEQEPAPEQPDAVGDAANKEKGDGETEGAPPSVKRESEVKFEDEVKGKSEGEAKSEGEEGKSEGEEVKSEGEGKSEGEEVKSQGEEKEVKFKSEYEGEKTESEDEGEGEEEVGEAQTEGGEKGKSGKEAAADIIEGVAGAVVAVATVAATVVDEATDEKDAKKEMTPEQIAGEAAEGAAVAMEALATVGAAAVDAGAEGMPLQLTDYELAESKMDTATEVATLMADTVADASREYRFSQVDEDALEAALSVTEAAGAMATVLGGVFDKVGLGPDRRGEEEYEEEQEEEEPFDRKAALEEYHELLNERTRYLKQNLILQKMIYELMKKRRSTMCFEEITPQEHRAANMYIRLLMSFGKFLQYNEEYRAELEEEVAELQEQQAAAEERLEEAMRELESRLREVAEPGLILSSTGNPISDKVIERLMTRTQDMFLQLYKERLRYMRLRNCVQYMEDEAKRLDQKFGSGLSLYAYEHLREENQTLCDRIEVRDEELAQLRQKAAAAVQVLAHIREKASFTSLCIESLYEGLEQIEMETERLRATINGRKEDREQLRAEYEKLRKSAGMLVERKLLRDMERLQHLSPQLEEQLQELRALFDEKRLQLSNLQADYRAIARDQWAEKRLYRGSYEAYKSLLSKKLKEKREAEIPCLTVRCHPKNDGKKPPCLLKKRSSDYCSRRKYILEQKKH